MLGQKIKNLREAQGLTQTQLASLLELDISTISKIENNKANPSMLTLYKIADILNVTPSKLLEGTDKPA